MQIQVSTGAKKPKQTRLFYVHTGWHKRRSMSSRYHQVFVVTEIVNREDWREPVVSDDTKSSSGAVQGRPRPKKASSLSRSSFQPDPPPIQ